MNPSFGSGSSGKRPPKYGIMSRFDISRCQDLPPKYGMIPSDFGVRFRNSEIGQFLKAYLP